MTWWSRLADVNGLTEPNSMPRIITMIASATEIVCALGHGRDLVGRSHECDYPPSIRKLPVTTSPSILTEGSSREIDQRIENSLRNALSIYAVDSEILQTLKPDIIITQTQCDVCAVSLGDVEKAVRELTDTDTTIVSLQTNSLADLWNDINKIAEAIGDSTAGSELIAAMKGHMWTIAERAKTVSNRPTVAAIEWIDPLMASGNWMPELISMAGGENLFGKAGQHSPHLSWEQLVSSDPDIILLLPCGWDIDKTRQETATLAAKPDWPGLNAVKTERVYLLDGNRYFNRPGPRLSESLEILAEIIHPDTFRFGHRDDGWTVWSP
jgi:iron complex transport system substrate-binding protein